MLAYKILIVEDEEVIRKVLQRHLEKLGYKLYLAATVNEAYLLMQTAEPDLLITDLKLPDGDGSDVIHRFKEIFPKKEILIITGSPSPEKHLENVQKDNMPAILCKPFELKELEEKIKFALSRKAPKGEI